MFIKRFITAICFLGIAQVSIAGTMGPEEHSTWMVGGYALYLQPVTDNLQTMPVNIATSTGVSLTVGDQFPWTWGFKLQAAYHDVTSEHNLGLNWYHLKSALTNTSVTNTATNISLSVFGQASIQYAATQLSASEEWDAINFEVDREFTFGKRDRVRVFGGGLYTRLKTINNAQTTVNVSANTIIANLPLTSLTLNVTQNGSYNGFGPRIGADLFHNLIPDLSLYAKGATAILAGSMHESVVVRTRPLPIVRVTGSVTAVVPEFEASLGGTYLYQIKPDSLLEFDAGWMWTSYLNMAGINKYVQTTFSVEGLYFGLRWKSDVS